MTIKWSVCCYYNIRYLYSLNPLQRVVLSALFVFVELNGGSVKATVMTHVVVLSFFSFFFLFFYVCFLIYLPAGLMRASSSSASVVLVLATAVIFVLFCPCNRFLFLFSMSRRMLFFYKKQPFLFDFLASHSSRHLSFFLLVIVSFFSLFFRFFFSLFFCFSSSFFFLLFL